ncbi:MAG TPA: hypothetical protein VIW24_29585 [Aldersonia sp.]
MTEFRQRTGRPRNAVESVAAWVYVAFEAHGRTRKPSRAGTAADKDAGSTQLQRRGQMTPEEKLTDVGSYPRRIAGAYDVDGETPFGSGPTIGIAAERRRNRT